MKITVGLPVVSLITTTGDEKAKLWGFYSVPEVVTNHCPRCSREERKTAATGGKFISRCLLNFPLMSFIVQDV